MMYKTNFIVLVLSSARHKVIIWDDHERKNRTEITFNSVIKAVKLRKDMLVIVLELKTFIFSFVTLQLIEQVETATNALGLCGIATNERAVSKVIALPNPNKRLSRSGAKPKPNKRFAWFGTKSKPDSGYHGFGT